MRLFTARTVIPLTGMLLGFIGLQMIFAAESNGGSPAAHKAMPSLPAMRLGNIDGFDDEAQYVAVKARRAEELVNAASAQAMPSQQATYILAAANLVLAEQLAPEVSRRFLKIEGAAAMSDDDAKATLHQLDEWLSRAAQLIDSIAEPSGDEKEEAAAAAAPTRSELARRLGILQAFAHAIRAFVMSDSDAQSVRHAISTLSVPLEDPNSDVAAAAEFWRTCLQDREESSAAGSLQSPFRPIGIAVEVQPYSFFNRLLRCRRAADRGGYALALASLIDLRERAEQSFTGATQRQALRTIALWRVRVLSDWYAHLDAATQTEERDWCADQAERIIAEQFKDEHAGLLRIRPAIPIVASPPKPDQPTDESEGPPDIKPNKE